MERARRFRDPIRGRGTQHDPPNRFESLALEPDPECGFEERGAPGPATTYLRDPSRSIVARNDSPDVGFDASINPYRGCEHGCAYCYARPTHEYLGFSAGLDFERRILVKTDAPALLRRELTRPGWVPRVVALSGVTDPYQPIERRLRVTRGCLEVLAEHRNPVAIITKSGGVTRDLDLLVELARHRAVSVALSVTTLDPDLARRLEPRAAQPASRLAAIAAVSRAGVPVGVMVAPVIPAITDCEIPRILKAAAEAGAHWASYIMLRLPLGVKEIFSAWLDDHRPERRRAVLSRVRQVRGGRLYDPRWNVRQSGEGPFAEQVRALVDVGRRRHGLAERGPLLSTAAFRRGPLQLDLL